MEEFVERGLSPFYKFAKRGQSPFYKFGKDRS